MTAVTTWTEVDYPFAAGSGAIKLAQSAVAPLVAHARGYRKVTKDGLKALYSAQGWHAASDPAKQARRAVGDSDAMWMPWWTADLAVEMARKGVEYAAASAQLRPAPENVVIDNNRPRKYVNIAGQATIIGLHPAFPHQWVATAATYPIMFAEGLLKSDSALTAMLLSAGIDPADLLVHDGETLGAARVRLRTMLERIPEDRRVIIYGFLSVTTWKNKPEWVSISLRDRDVYVAFDGDVATKPTVWKPARELFDVVSAKHGRPHLVDLSAYTMPDGSKCGLDDYLAAGYGTWSDLLTCATPSLPPRPAGADDGKPGQWRMNLDKHVTEKYVPPTQEDEAGSWRTAYPFAARLTVVEDLRSVTDAESRTGVYRSREDARDQNSRVEIEFTWTPEQGGDPRVAVVSGPHDILLVPPASWRLIPGVSIPSSISMLPDFPPKEAEFTSALKRSGVDALVRPLWDHMGWVPRMDGGTPVFIVGDQAIGEHGEMPDAAASGVSTREVRVASKFGVIVPGDDNEARAALREVMDLYLPVDDHLPVGERTRIWQSPMHASVVLAAALRPTVPLPCRVPVVITGASNAGKTYASGAAMMFWQSVPGTWHDKSVPGSASDTEASSEVSISKTPIWVIDDLAPSADDPVGHKRSAAGLWRLVRGVSNGSARGRRKADMSAQDVNTPRALLIVSAEQAPENDTSIMNRIVNVRVESGKFLTPNRALTTHLVQVGSTRSPQSVVTGYILRMLARRASRSGWTALLDELGAAMTFYKADAAKVMGGGGDATRQATTVADLSLGLVALSWMVTELGLNDEFDARISNMLSELWQAARAGYGTARSSSVGRRFMEALASMLVSHQAHVSSLGDGGLPVPVDHPQAAFLNDRLGWSLASGGNEPRPNGPKIGSVVYDSEGTLCVLFNHTAAFAEARRRMGGLDTYSLGAVWDSVHEGGFASTSWTRHRNSYVQRVTHGGMSERGVAIPVATLFSDAPEAPDPGYGA